MTGRTVKVVRSGRIPAPADYVFPLCCPVEEYKWIPGWKCELVNCPNERVELGTVFTEIVSPPILTGSPFGKTTWTAVLHDPTNHRLHFELRNVHSESLYEIEISDDDAGASVATLTFTYTALSDRGERVISGGLEEKLGFMLDYLALMLEHYCREGSCITAAAVAKFVAESDALGPIDKARLAIGRLRMLLMRDELRDRYLSELAEGKR